MNSRMNPLPLLLTVIGACSAPRAQVQLHEVFFDTGSNGTQWIELHNAGTATQDLSGWTVYLATTGPRRESWWGFPVGARIGAGQYLRVHWRAAIQPSTATDVYTGTLNSHFLFGLGSHPMQGSAGALGLLSTQISSQTLQPTEWQDYVSWGQAGFPRELLAVRSAKWLRGQFAGATQADDSLALDQRTVRPRRGNDWFADATPTPLAANDGGARIQSYGLNCSLGVVNPPVVEPISRPVPGNRNFGIRVRNTASGENVILVLGAQRGDGRSRLGPCSLWVGGGPTQILAFPASQLVTDIPASLADPRLNGGLAYLQAVTYLTSLDFGTSQGLSIQIGVR